MKSEAEVDRAFVYAKSAGFKMIIGVPTYELLPYTSKKAQEYDIPVAIHNHGPDNPLFPTPQSAYERIASLDRRLGLCMDVGHTQRSGVDPSGSAEKSSTVFSTSTSRTPRRRPRRARPSKSAAVSSTSRNC